MAERFDVSHSESAAESSVVQLYAGALVRDRTDRKDVNLSVCRIDVCPDPHVMRVDTVENLWVADFPNPAIPVCGESFAIAANLARKARRLVGTLARAGVVIRSRVYVLRVDSERQQRQEGDC
jgi:hypothetical protein